MARDELPEVVEVPPDKREEAYFELFRRLELSPEEFAARHGHEFAMFNFHNHNYQRSGMRSMNAIHSRELPPVP